MLKSLELVGFKSFAEKTRLEFPAGVTAVVGPNGSGKSNVVDAVKWVLGSQSPRTLRGKEMTDVIFNGSESRGPLHCAEATLAFDNRPRGESERRIFDLDENEVRLTRRVHRSGEGEYLVNGRNCRLKDFRALLAGTGVGAESYSIIEQGRVDAALRASPLERRLLLEEAAGVSRFRLKKREAAKRLDVVEQNLLRLSDIVDEVEGRLRRVRSQAGKARKYREASLRLKEARTELATDEWRRSQAERLRLDGERENYEQRAAELRAEIAEQESRLERLEDDGAVDDRRERELHESRRRAARHERDEALARSEVERVAEKLAETRRRWIEARRAALAAGRDNPAQEAIAAAVSTAADYDRSLQESEQAVAIARNRVAEAASHAQRVASRRDRVLAVLRRGEATVAALASRRDNLATLLDEGDEEEALCRKQSDEAIDALEAAGSRRDEAADALLRLDREHAEIHQRLTGSRRQLAAQQRSLSQQRERLAETRAQAKSLQEEHRRVERLNAEVVAAVDATNAAGRPAPDIHGLVADLIHVEADFVPLVEAALGQRAEHVVVDRRDALLDALEVAGGADAFSSRVGFEAADGAPQLAAVDQIDLSAEQGVLGRAEDFVEVEPRHAKLIRRLLTRTWFVDTLATARRLSDSVGRGVAFVTLRGETIGADQTVACGANPLAGPSLTRRNDLVRLEAEIAEAERRVEAEGRGVAEIERQIAELEARSAEVQQGANDQRGLLAAAAQHAATLDERKRLADNAAERLAAQHANRSLELDAVEARLENLQQRLRGLSPDGQADPGSDHESDSRVRQAEAELAAQQARFDELRVAAARHAELLESLRREAAASPTATPERESLDSLRLDATRLAGEMTAAQLVELRARACWDEELLRVDRLTGELAQARAARHASEQVRLQVASAVAQARAEADELTRRSAEAELRRQRVEMEAKAAAQRVRDDYGVDVVAEASSEGATLEDQQRRALREEVEKLRSEVQSVGAVNLESLEELDELESRFERLSGQYEDLSQAKKSLSRLTTRIDSESRELFVATYETVREHFRELFSRLFGGGEADLVLVDPSSDSESADPLDGGVEIVACPPGKELRNLSLLSGGEKTMTCVALLLALFRSRPSPFCLLDEVDAALDEANVGRFCDVLKDFLGATQFIVVTHSRRTMAGADTIYGVTMQEAGVSTHLSVRVDDVSEDGTLSMTSNSVAPIRRAA